MTPKKYRKKPVEIEAMKFAVPSDGPTVAYWCGGLPHVASKPSDRTDVAYWIEIPTLEGVMRADLGDYVIKGVQGEFYPCKPDIFATTYEEVES